MLEKLVMFISTLALAHCGSVTTTESTVPVVNFSASCHYQSYTGNSLASDANREPCTNTYSSYIGNNGSGQASGNCLSPNGAVVTAFYANPIILSSAALTSLHACVSDNPLDNVPLLVDCSLGPCGSDADTISLTLVINNIEKTYQIDLNLSSDIPSHLKEVMNCLYDSGMLPSLHRFS